MALQITPLPPAPNRLDPSTFRARADAHVAALDQFTNETNALATEAETHAAEAETSALNAANSASIASNSAGLTNYKGDYVGATAYVVGDSVSYTGYFWICKQASTGNAPVEGSAYWVRIAPIGGTSLAKLYYLGSM